MGLADAGRAVEHQRRQVDRAGERPFRPRRWPADWRRRRQTFRGWRTGAAAATVRLGGGACWRVVRAAMQPAGRAALPSSSRCCRRAQSCRRRFRSMRNRGETPGTGACRTPRGKRPRCAGGSSRESSPGRTGSARRSAARRHRSPAAFPRRTTDRIVFARPCRPAQCAKPTRSPYRPWSLPMRPWLDFTPISDTRRLDSIDASNAVKPAESGQRQDFFLSAIHGGEIPGESRQLAVARTAEFFSRADSRRGKHVGIARANGGRQNAKPFCVGNWIARCKILPEIWRGEKTVRRCAERTSFPVLPGAAAGGFRRSPRILAQSASDRLNRQIGQTCHPQRTVNLGAAKDLRCLTNSPDSSLR